LTIIKASSVDDVMPPAPSWLGERAAEKWRVVWPLLEHSRVNPQLHGDLVAMYCQAYADLRDSCDHIARSGSVVKDKNDRVVSNPFVEIRDTAMRQMIDIGKTLGLSPDCSVSWSDYAPTGQEIYDDPTDAGDAGSHHAVADEQH